MVGELYLAGPGLARGYLGLRGQTAQAFVADPFGADSSGRAGERMYRTGDRVRWRADGPLEFLGRLAHLVKLRGFRNELAEIEAVMLQSGGVRDAAVIVRDQRLVAYVVGEVEVDALRTWLRGRLPEYMVPGAFVTLPALPTNANGKLDRRALPAPVDDGAGARPQVAPRTPTEREVAAIWADVLGVRAVGADDRFFDIGGDSLHLVRVHRQLSERYPGLVTLVELFQHTTVAAISRRVDEQRGRSAAPSFEGIEI
jgi:hypothetical protein